MKKIERWVLIFLMIVTTLGTVSGASVQSFACEDNKTIFVNKTEAGFVESSIMAQTDKKNISENDSFHMNVGNISLQAIQTGDNTRILEFVLLLLGALPIIVGALVIKRRRNR